MFLKKLINLQVTLATDYYKQDFFPIGFTGFEFTGWWTSEGQPYPDDINS